MSITLAADAVVVGSGAAGLSAAHAVARSGLHTIVLERAALLGGTSATSGGLVYAPGSGLAREAGHEIDANHVKRYVTSVARRSIEQDLLQAYLEAVPRMVAELGESGVRWRLTGLLDYYRDAPGAARGRVLATEPFDPTGLGDFAKLVRRSPYRESDAVPWTGGMSLVGNLVEACLRAGVEFRTGCRASKLMLEHGAVAGVEGGCGNGRLTVHSRNVVLASGGYEFNRALVHKYIENGFEAAWSCPTNEGDALEMAVSVNAAMSGMGEAQWYALLRLSDEFNDGAPLYADASPARHLPGSLIIDRRGERFANEGGLFQDFGRALADARTSRTPAWLVMDQQFIDSYRERSFGDQSLGPPAWVTADSLAELANSVDVLPEVLTATVERFNEGAIKGIDPDFGRGESDVDREWADTTRDGAEACLAPLKRAPFHATRVYAGCSGTTGGPSVDENAQVKDVDARPIRGLYAAGNAIAGLFGDTAPASGSTLGPGMTFGFLAGHAIVRTAAER